SHLQQHFLTLIKLSLVEVKRCEVGVCRVDIRLQRERLLILTNGIRYTLNVLVSLAKVEMRPRLLRSFCYRVLPQRHVARKHGISGYGHQSENQNYGGRRKPTQTEVPSADPV